MRCRANAVRRRLRRRAHRSVPASQSRPAPNHCRKHNEERGVPPLDPRQPLAQHMMTVQNPAHHRDTFRFVVDDISSYGQGWSGRAEEGELQPQRIFIGWLMVGLVVWALAEGRRRHDDATDGDIATATVHRTPPWSVIVQQAAISCVQQRDTDATHVPVCYPTTSEEKK